MDIENQKSVFDLETIKNAYLLLKRDVYYETTDLFVRRKIADFDASKDSQNEIKQIFDFLLSFDLTSTWFKNQLKSIDVNFIPKKIKLDQSIKDDHDLSISFISNIRTQNKYDLEEINYFFTSNIPLYILSTLWCMTVGPIIDTKLSKNCYGNRLDFQNVGQQNHYRLFKIYINQYNRWRDDAIRSSLDLLEKDDDVLLISMDLKQCFYRLPVNWDVLKSEIRNCDLEDKDFYLFLTDVISEIHNEYYKKTKIFLDETHVLLYDGKKIPKTEIIEAGIPVGLPSSRILSNWELKVLDEQLEDTLRPIFYGRYVDDLLLVIHNPGEKICENKEKILQKFFIEQNIIEKFLGSETDSDSFETNLDLGKKSNQEDYLYKLCRYKNLFIQNSKLIIHYYDHEHTWAGLKEFREELKRRVSEYRFLPEEDKYKDLVDEAYDILYRGSVNKFRSVIGISENATKLSQYLYKQQLKYWLCDDKLRDKTIQEIFQFYKGINIFDYCRLWERIFTLFIISKKYNDFVKFYYELDSTIKKISFENNSELAKNVRNSCNDLLLIASNMALGYLGSEISKNETGNRFFSLVGKYLHSDHLNQLEKIKFPKDSLSMKLRSSMLLRYQNMCWPLLDYSNYEGNLSRFSWENLDSIELNKEKVKNSTRFIQVDEYELFILLKDLLKLKNTKRISTKIENEIPSFNIGYLISNSLLDEGSKSEAVELSNIKTLLKKVLINPQPQKKSAEYGVIKNHEFASDGAKRGKFRIGIVNIKVNSDEIEAAYNPRKKPNCTYERQKTLFNLINQGIEHPTCDLIVFPEVCIPFTWLPFMVSQARRSDIGMVFGLEHIVIGKYALNLVATALPFKTENNHHNVFLSLRLKNHYSPAEECDLNRLNLSRPEYRDDYYETFSWRGAIFPVYNCYELTNIKARALFRSDIDLLIAVEYNKDINYFSNILEATTRDIHCFSAQANSSDFGDSRVISPKSTEKMNIIRVKGGENPVLLKTELDIEDLRNFQSKCYDPTTDVFKPTPAGYDHEKARKRK